MSGSPVSGPHEEGGYSPIVKLWRQIRDELMKNSQLKIQNN
jgi:hypothetical protein